MWNKNKLINKHYKSKSASQRDFLLTFEASNLPLTLRAGGLFYKDFWSVIRSGLIANKRYLKGGFSHKFSIKD